MMSEESKLREALEADEIGMLDRLIRERREDDFAALMELLAPGARVAPAKRARAIYALGRWGNPKAVAPLLLLLPRADADLRVRIVDSLARLGTLEALDAVAGLAADSSVHVRKFVALGLGRSGAPRARERLREMVRHDPEPFIRDLAGRLAG